MRVRTNLKAGRRRRCVRSGEEIILMQGYK